MPSIISRLCGRRDTGIPPQPVDGTRLQTIETRLAEVSHVDVSHAASYSENVLRVSSFEEWAHVAMGLYDPDRIRNAIYYGFQPLFDALIRGTGIDGIRETAVQALDGVISIGITFLTGYYMGRPDDQTFRKRMRALKPQMNILDGIGYHTKFRNVDSNGIYPKDIHHFLERFLELILDGKALSAPDYIIGCACGSSEIVMPLAGLLDTRLGFIRRSFRRGDNKPRIVAEHDERFRREIRGKTVICIEDYVCTGASLAKVMEKTRAYGAANVQGASVNRFGGCNHLQERRTERKFHLYSST